MSVEPAWSVRCSVAREGQKCPAEAHGATAPQDFGIHSWDKLVQNFVLVHNGFPRLQIQRKLAVFISVTRAAETWLLCCVWNRTEQSVDCCSAVCMVMA